MIEESTACSVDRARRGMDIACGALIDVDHIRRNDSRAWGRDKTTTRVYEEMGCKA